MRKGSALVAIGFLFPVLIVLAALSLPSTNEGTVPTTIKVAIDVDTRGNGDNTLGLTDTCNRTTLQVGETIDIDVVVRGIPEYEKGPKTGAIVGADFNLLFDPAVVQVNKFLSFDGPTILKARGETAPDGYVNYNFGGPSTRGANGPPGKTGNVSAGMIDLSTNVEDGDGVLARFTLQAVGAGASRIDLAFTSAGDDKPHVYGPNKEAYAVDESDGTILVGAGNCARPTPTTFPRIPETASPTTAATAGVTRDEGISVAAAEPPNQARAAATETDGPPWSLVGIGAGLCVIGIGAAFAYVRRRRV